MSVSVCAREIVVLTRRLPLSVRNLVTSATFLFFFSFFFFKKGFCSVCQVLTLYSCRSLLLLTQVAPPLSNKGSRNNQETPQFFPFSRVLGLVSLFFVFFFFLLKTPDDPPKPNSPLVKFFIIFFSVIFFFLQWTNKSTCSSLLNGPSLPGPFLPFPPILKEIQWRFYPLASFSCSLTVLPFLQCIHCFSPLCVFFLGPSTILALFFFPPPLTRFFLLALRLKLRVAVGFSGFSFHSFRTSSMGFPFFSHPWVFFEILTLGSMWCKVVPLFSTFFWLPSPFPRGNAVVILPTV